MEVPSSPRTPESLFFHIKDVLEDECAQKCVKWIVLPLF